MFLHSFLVLSFSSYREVCFCKFDIHSSFSNLTHTHGIQRNENFERNQPCWNIVRQTYIKRNFHYNSGRTSSIVSSHRGQTNIRVNSELEIIRESYLRYDSLYPCHKVTSYILMNHAALVSRA